MDRFEKLCDSNIIPPMIPSCPSWPQGLGTSSLHLHWNLVSDPPNLPRFGFSLHFRSGRYCHPDHFAVRSADCVYPCPRGLVAGTHNPPAVSRSLDFSWVGQVLELPALDQNGVSHRKWCALLGQNGVPSAEGRVSRSSSNWMTFSASLGPDRARHQR